MWTGCALYASYFPTLVSEISFPYKFCSCHWSVLLVEGSYLPMNNILFMLCCVSHKVLHLKNLSWVSSVPDLTWTGTEKNQYQLFSVNLDKVPLQYERKINSRTPLVCLSDPGTVFICIVKLVILSQGLRWEPLWSGFFEDATLPLGSWVTEEPGTKKL